MESDTNTKTLLRKMVGSVSERSGAQRLSFKKYYTGKRRKKYHPARLIALITGVNLVPVLLFVFALIFLGEYRGTLIKTELELTKTQSDLVTLIVTKEYQKIADGDKNILKNISSVFPQDNNIRVALFNKDGALVLNTIEYESLGTQGSEAGWLNRTIGGFLSIFFDLFQIEYNLPSFPLIEGNALSSLPGLDSALNGQASLSAWSINRNQLLFTSATPIRKLQNIEGAVFFAKPATAIDTTFNELRNDIFRIFLIVIFISSGVSLFLVQALATPLRRLADAAESIRHGSASLADIPDMSGRGDEIGELSIALRSLVQALWERMDNIERFAADVSHELKNPITSMQSALETLSNVKKAEDRKKLLAILRQDVRRLDKLVTDISQATKLDVALSREKMEKVDLGKLLRNIKNGYMARLENLGSNQIIFFDNLASDGCFITGNQDRLTQVFTNIIDNALSFSPDTGEIHIRLSARATAYEIHITDQGIGIPAGKESKIFERFYSERPEGEHFGEHSGLGLSICQQIIHAHAGIIETKNNEEGGAKFIIILPKATFKV